MKACTKRLSGNEGANHTLQGTELLIRSQGFEPRIFCIYSVDSTTDLHPIVIKTPIFHCILKLHWTRSPTPLLHIVSNQFRNIAGWDANDCLDVTLFYFYAVLIFLVGRIGTQIKDTKENEQNRENAWRKHIWHACQAPCEQKKCCHPNANLNSCYEKNESNNSKSKLKKNKKLEIYQHPVPRRTKSTHVAKWKPVHNTQANTQAKV